MTDHRNSTPPQLDAVISQLIDGARALIWTHDLGALIQQTRIALEAEVAAMRTSGAGQYAAPANNTPCPLCRGTGQWVGVDDADESRSP